MSGPSTHVDHLIDRQVRLWSLRQEMVQVTRTVGQATRPRLPGPWITLSRQIGSRGTELAEELSRRLGWQVFDKQILSAISRRDPARERFLSRLDEHAVGALEDYLNQLFVRDSMSHFDYIREVMRIVCMVGRQGKVILVGRGANWLLDPRFGVRVRVVAPLEQRASRVAKREGMDLPSARRWVQAQDHETARFMRQTHHQNVENPLGYDLVLNLAKIDPPSAVDAVVTVLDHKVGLDRTAHR